MPLPGVEYRLAHYLMGPGDDVALGRRVLDSLVGRPQRYRDLRPLLRGKTDNQLTIVLRWLVEEGLAFTQGAPGHKGTLYELDILGAFVIRKMAAFEEAEAWRRYVAATGGAVHGPAH